MFLVHICTSRYARPFKSNNKHCKIFPFDDTKSAFAFADWWLKGSPVCVRIENYQDQDLDDEELTLQARENSDVIMMALLDDGTLEEEDIHDCSFIA